MVICLEQGADLHMAQLMPLPLTVSCFSKIQIGFTFLVPAHLGSPGQRAVKRMCVCVLYSVFVMAVILLRTHCIYSRLYIYSTFIAFSCVFMSKCYAFKINLIAVEGFYVWNLVTAALRTFYIITYRTLSVSMLCEKAGC